MESDGLYRTRPACVMLSRAHLFTRIAAPTDTSSAVYRQTVCVGRTVYNLRPFCSQEPTLRTFLVVCCGPSLQSMF